VTQRFPLFFTAVIGAAAFVSACGGAATNTANSANSTNANKASKSGNSNSAGAVSSAPPLVKTIDELQSSTEWMDASETPGRMFKITGNLAIANDERLIIGYANNDTAPGNSITCKGNFSKYSGLEDKIKGLAKQNKAPKVVIEGKFNERDDDTITLEPCVMTDLPN
jgi:hypothetical protein